MSKVGSSLRLRPSEPADYGRLGDGEAPGAGSLGGSSWRCEKGHRTLVSKVFDIGASLYTLGSMGWPSAKAQATLIPAL
jgi:hypothetical protein